MSHGGGPAIERYLERIGVERPDEPSADALRRLHAAHLMAVPFENLSIHMGEPIALDADSLHDKLVTRRRGGFCYELNGAFAGLLTALGFRVALLAARVFDGDGLGQLFDHLALRVDAAEPWLVDVGFGAHSLFPLRLDHGREQADPGGTFVIADASGGDIDVIKDGKPQYRMERRERTLDDFVPMCWWQQTSPDSHFTRSLVCSRPTANGRVTLSDRLLVRTLDGDRVEATLSSDEAVIAAYLEHFGIVLARAPHVRPAMTSEGGRS